MQSRRDFLRSIPLITGTMVFGAASLNAQANPKLKTAIGIQLWTLRDAIKDDLNGTLEALSEMGYNSIEAFGFDGNLYGQSASDFSSHCAKIGLGLHSSHTGITAANADAFSQEAANAGLEFLILPSMMGRPENTIDDFRRTAEEMNQIGEKCLKNGIRFGYHNHDFEFRLLDGQLPYDILLNETDPSLVSFQLDIFWIVKAGKDPLDYFEKHPGRFTTWHVKDKSTDGASCIVGNGTIDYVELLKASELSGLERIFVEQEQYAEGTPLFCAGQSIKYIQKHFF